MRRTTRPEPPREAPLIDAARRRARITVREAARQSRVSEAHWRQIISGYESLGGGEYREVHAKPETLARIAQVVGITPDQLIKVGRDDAARALEEITPDPAPEPERRTPRPWTPCTRSWRPSPRRHRRKSSHASPRKTPRPYARTRVSSDRQGDPCHSKVTD
ncbi:helix-turn-helix transcriptional regulator [Streptomyces sp. MNU103]|uniref:helix-turn-helix transcriptional regulator n=1 Tax=Streptomyces sp. MNU103 TaxID=2560024 RepID=UPI001E4AED9E|nr:helix-turn-helix transcriptional regulator [Streptomyces sp. MNU103]